MPDVARIRVTWTGAPVTGPGVSTFYLNSSVTAGWPAALMTLFTALKNNVPPGITWTIPGDADILDMATGVLKTTNSPGGGGTIVSNGSPADYKPGVGARIRWNTTGVVGGRRVKGTTFVVPLYASEIPNGVLNPLTASSWTTAANAYKNTTGIVPAIYSRPRPARTVKGVSHPARDGSIANITSVAVPSTLSWLRTRRT